MRRLRQGLLLFALVVTAQMAFGAETDSVERTDVFVSGTDGYHTFRIPVALVTPAGDLLAFCEGRKSSRNDHGDIDLVLRRSGDGGKTWGPLQIVYEEGGDAKTTIGNPCPVVDRSTGTIWLPFCRNNDDVFITHSTDDGKTWSQPKSMTAQVKRPEWGWYATGPGVGIQMESAMHRGRLVIPCDHREKIDGNDVMFSHVFYSDDHGQTWKLGGSADKHTDECQLAELSDGRLMINMRNYWGQTGKVAERAGMRAVAFSADGGDYWSPVEFHHSLVEPICQASLLRVSPTSTGDKRLLFSNPASKITRHSLTVRLSEDEGQSWPVAKVLHFGPSAYSCLTVLPDQTIGCLFEGGTQSANEKIIFARFPLRWLSSK